MAITTFSPTDMGMNTAGPYNSTEIKLGIWLLHLEGNNAAVIASMNQGANSLCKMLGNGLSWQLLLAVQIVL